MANPKLPEVGIETRFGAGKNMPGANPAKRAVGRAAWNALLADFEENGVQAIIDMREKKPEAYVALAASGLPAEKAVDLTVRRVESLSEEQARMMAEEILERHKRIGTGSELAAGVHDSHAAGLSASAAAPQDQ